MMRRGSWRSLASWTLAVLLLSAPSAGAEDRPDEAASGSGGSETMTYVRIGNALACEFGLSVSMPVPPFVAVVGYLQCNFWPEVHDDP